MHFVAIVVQKLYVFAEHAVAEPIGSRRKLRGDSRIHICLVALVAGQCQRRRAPIAQDGWQKLVERDVLQLRDHHPAGVLKKLFVGPRWIARGGSSSQPIVLSQKQRLHRDEFGVFVGSHVAGQKELAIGYPMRFVGVGKA